MFTVTKERIAAKRFYMQDVKPELCQKMKSVGDETIGEIDIIDTYAIICVIYEQECRKDDYGEADEFMKLISSLETSASTGDSYEMKITYKYYLDCFQKKVEVC